MKLNYRLRIKDHLKETTPIIMIHGLFGNLNNLGKIANNLSENNYIIQIDLRNHGQSPHAQSMTYIDMAQDIIELLDHLLIKKCIIIGHSMGGKVAMMICMLAAQRIHKAIIIDIAPIQYNMEKYNSIFNAIKCVNKFKITDKITAIRIMKQYISNISLILFLLKSFYQGSWNFNFLYIENNYYNIGDWPIFSTWWGSILFIKGENSDYLHDKYICDIYHQFPKANFHNVPNAGHWVHYENSVHVSNIIKNFIV